MTYVITQGCCSDASCVLECPVDCIRPTPDERAFGSTEMLHIDPDTCIDCGACMDACPVDAVFPDSELPDAFARFTDINARYFERNPLEPSGLPPRRAKPDAERGPLRVAIVGAGPAAAYVAEELLARKNVEVEVFDRLPTPWGLLRSGVAPDHLSTKKLTNLFDRPFASAAFSYHLNVEVGTHVSVAELLDHHHAVVLGVGASTGRSLEIPGADLPGSHTATDFVAWYNGHPDYADLEFDLSGERAVIVGNGNVAIDVARVLTMSPEALAASDIAPHALEALRHSNIREVVLLGRRGPLQASYTTGEFMALGHLDGIDVVIDPAEVVLDPHSQELVSSGELELSAELKVELAQEYAARPASGAARRIVFRYLQSPAAVTGPDRVTGVELVRNELVEDDGALRARPTDDIELVEASLVLSSIGYVAQPLPGVPFDDRRGVVPNDGARVLHETGGSPEPGIYATGWFKRGATGGIGSNRVDATETVDALVADFNAGVLAAGAGSRDDLIQLLDVRRPERLDASGWSKIDAHERALGTAAGRPRSKLVSLVDLLQAAGAGSA